MIVRELLTRLGYEVDKDSEKRGQDSISRLKSAAGALAAVFATGALAQGIGKALNLASDVEETMNVVSTAFEDQTDTVLEWARVQGEAVGRSEFLLREYASSIGAVVGPTLGAADATAEMSTGVAGLAVDLASFFNTTESDALQALRSGLIGQSEPLLRFGVAMNVATLDAFALEQGLGKTTKQMTQAEKITLRYQFILDQTAKAQGDAAKTAGGFANLTKAAGQQVRDLATNLGLVLLPIATEALQSFVDITKVLRGPLSSAFEVIGGNIKFVVTLIRSVIHGIGQMSAGFQALAVAAGLAWAVISAPGLVFIAIAALVSAAVAVIIQDFNRLLVENEGVIAGLIKEFEFWRDQTGSIMDSIVQIVGETIDFWAEKLFGIVDVQDEINKGWEQGNKTLQIYADAGTAALNAITEAIDFVIDSVRILTNLGPTFDNMAASLTLAGDAFNSVSALASQAGDFVASGLGGRLPSFAGPGASSVNAPQNIEVTVNAPGGNGPEIAAAVGPAVGAAGAAANRELRQTLLAGGGS